MCFCMHTGVFFVLVSALTYYVGHSARSNKARLCQTWSNQAKGEV